MENFSWKQWLVKKHRSDDKLGHMYLSQEAACNPPYHPLPSLSIGYRLNRRREAGKILAIFVFFHCQTNFKTLASGVMGGLAFIL